MIKFSYLALGLLLLSSGLVFSGEKSIPLWDKGKTPYARPVDEKTGSPSLHLYPLEKGNGAAVVVCPGGGYGGLARDHEGHQIANWYNERGVAAFVLHYRLGSQGHHFPTQLADVQRAIRLVRSHSSDWKVDPNRIGVMGFSAGGHLASMAATKFGEKAYDPVDSIDEKSARPDFAVLCYPVIAMAMDSEFPHTGSRRNLLGPDQKDDEAAALHVSSERNITDQTPPTFLFHTNEDSAVPPENSIQFYLGLRKHKIPSELHIYQSGPHGVGLFEGDPILGTWSGHLEDWLRSNGFFAGKLQRAAVSGTVSLDGHPISWGTVTFHPGDKNLPVVPSRIRNGKFSASSKNGPVTGTCQITFSGSIWEKTGKAEDGLIKQASLSPDGPPVTAEVTEGARFNWELKSK